MVLEDEKDESEQEEILDDYQMQKQIQKNNRLVKKIEEKISSIEKEIEFLTTEYTKDEYQTDFNKLCEISMSIDEKKKEVDKLMNDWEELQTKI